MTMHPSANKIKYNTIYNTIQYFRSSPCGYLIFRDLYPAVHWTWAAARESWRSAVNIIVGEKSAQELSSFHLPGRWSAYDVKLVSAYEVMENLLA